MDDAETKAYLDESRLRADVSDGSSGQRKHIPASVSTVFFSRHGDDHHRHRTTSDPDTATRITINHQRQETHTRPDGSSYESWGDVPDPLDPETVPVQALTTAPVQIDLAQQMTVAIGADDEENTAAYEPDPATAAVTDEAAIADQETSPFRPGQRPDTSDAESENEAEGGTATYLPGGLGAEPMPEPEPRSSPAIERPLLSRDGQRGPLSGAVWDDYRLGDLLGQGAMATVYLAQRIRDGTLVALKILPGHHAADPIFIQRFQLEARTASAIQHPNVAAVFQAGQYGDILYLEMELIEGGTLQDLCAQRHAARQPFTIEEICNFGIDLARALEAAHQHQLVHRDIKPGNLLLTRAGVGKLADFGIVKVLGEQQLTMTGSTVGTPTYMSPEQGRGDELDIRSDLYSAGVLLYELVCFRPPFEADSSDGLVYQHNFGEASLLTERRSDCPEALQAVIFTCLQKDPERRYADPTALGRDLTAARDGEPVETPLASQRRIDLGGKRALRALHGRPWLRATILAIVLTGLVVLLATWWHQRRQRIDHLRGRLAVLDAAAPVPDNINELLAQLGELVSTNDADLQRHRATLARIAANRELLAEAPVLPDWHQLPAIETAFRELLRDCGTEDASVLQWQPQLDERQRRVTALRERLARIDRAAPVTLALLDELADELAEARRLLPPNDPDRQRWEERAQACRQQVTELRAAIATQLAAGVASQAERASLRVPSEALAHRAGADDPAVVAARAALAQAATHERRLRQTCAALDRGSIASIAAITASTAALDELATLVAADDADLLRWQARVATSQQRQEQLHRELDELSSHTVLRVDAQQRLAVALDELAAIRGADDPQLATWRSVLDTARRELAGLQSRFVNLRTIEVFSASQIARLAQDLPRLHAFGAIDPSTLHELRSRMVRSEAVREDLRQALGVLDEPQPRDPALQAQLEAFLRLAGPEDPDARRWQARLARLEELHRRLAILDRRQSPPPDYADQLDAYTALVGPLDADLLHWRARHERITRLRHDLRVLNQAGLPPAHAAEALVELIELIGSDDPQIQTWRAQLDRTSALLAWLPRFEARRVLQPADRDRVQECAERLGPHHPASQRAAARLAQLDPAPPAWATTCERDAWGLRATLPLADQQLALRWIPPGDFLLGSPLTESGRESDEAPVMITISRGFWLAERECSQALYQALMGQDPSPHTAPGLPVTRVSWQDVQAFLTRARDTVADLRLPSEAEWEFACRAGHTGPWPGPGTDPGQALQRWAWISGMCTSIQASGQLVPNDLGLHDMLGNCWEWCADAYGPYPGRPTADPLHSTGDKRVLRGGSYADAATIARHANRACLPPTARSAYVGFRLAISH